MVYISRVRLRMLREGVVTERRRSVQVWDVNRKAGTGVKRFESEGLKKRLKRDAAVRGLKLKLVLINRVVAL
jgi:hypothetical protein